MADYSQFTNYPESAYLYKKNKGFATKAIHAGQDPDQVHGSVNVPIHLSTTFAQKAPTDFYSQYEYARGGTPTRHAFEECIAACENGEYAIAFSSGCAAMTCVLHSLPKESHIIVSDDVYGGTNRYMRRFAVEKFNFNVEFVDLTDTEAFKNAFKENTALVWIETPTNPLIKLVDIEALVNITREKKKDTWVLVDNTFASPYLQNPMDLGVDITLHSVSKYIGGHSDVIMGALVFNGKEMKDKLFYSSISFGGCPSTFDCYLAVRGLKTLESRMKIHCRNAYSVAKWLEQHPLIEKVIFPGLESHPQHELAKKQQRGFGGMISFLLKGGKAEAFKFLSSCKLATLAESLGGVETLIEHPASMTHASVPAEVRAKLGITDNFIRLSCGVEDVEDIMADIDQALEKACKKEQ
ncbi:cystathionine beta-lyase/cystathionine gamma-synthase (macronuclear) [Tetrahymena thermophila SB210]|uniref:cystathionine gamma-lyase n=1 Tax=Tetrahymena thermophila (strain SB210) TaxID=312017 RepID=Q23CV0_TETTS|nr:cystathionine beta-lyase/cystathionine gamma-synthase [Tetrahymena thermophila SB210]EAR94324.1 cystathionine beta-lyase/cystathionine gamma-synthase [Tetrahymena thermophila SB210]|eukprot:XP_001014936.1 cystathionine beta-lyase/cystathionine gamma-synthase [Tetrahymena thermophila SB210]